MKSCGPRLAFGVGGGRAMGAGVISPLRAVAVAAVGSVWSGSVRSGCDPVGSRLRPIPSDHQGLASSNLLDEQHNVFGLEMADFV